MLSDWYFIISLICQDDGSRSLRPSNIWSIWWCHSTYSIPINKEVRIVSNFLVEWILWVAVHCYGFSPRLKGQNFLDNTRWYLLTLLKACLVMVNFCSCSFWKLSLWSFLGFLTLSDFWFLHFACHLEAIE